MGFREIYENIETVLARGIRPTTAKATPARPQVSVKRFRFEVRLFVCPCTQSTFATITVEVTPVSPTDFRRMTRVDRTSPFLVHSGSLA